MRLDHRGGIGLVGCRHIRLDSDGEFELQAEPPEFRTPYSRSRPMRTRGENDAGEGGTDTAKLLHRFRCQSDLVANGVTVLGAEQAHEFLLDVVRVRNRGGSLRT